VVQIKQGGYPAWRRKIRPGMSAKTANTRKPRSTKRTRKPKSGKRAISLAALKKRISSESLATLENLYPVNDLPVSLYDRAYKD
jgi:hypothetical protein